MTKAPLIEQLLSERAGRAVRPGEMLVVPTDRVYVQDGNAPTVARLFEIHGFRGVLNPERVAIVIDHASLSPEAAISDRVAEARRFAAKHGLEIVGEGQGISHVIAAERGWFAPGALVVGADSHTCTGGAQQALALGMGASDVVGAMVTGKIWLRVPPTVQIEVSGEPLPGTEAKDVALFALSRVPEQALLYRAVEWCGDWAANLSQDAAATVANLAVEMGAKCAFLPPGRDRPAPPYRPIVARADALRLDADGLAPLVARPGSPRNVATLDECAGQAIDYVFVGSCTNGRIEDLRRLVAAMDGRPVSPGVHCIVVPGSAETYIAALQEGLVERLVGSGALVVPPGCGPCVGTQGSVPPSGAQVLSTASRNFRGRMGNKDADIWLGSPTIAGHAAATGSLPASEALRR